MSTIRTAFNLDRVLLPVIHPVSREVALSGVETAIQCGCKGVFLINQGLDDDQTLALACEVKTKNPNLWVGINLLGYMPSRVLYRISKQPVQLDGIWHDDAGLDERMVEQVWATEFQSKKEVYNWRGILFGGVAFKYRRKIPDDQLERLTRIAVSYVDVVTTSGDATGVAPDVEKIKRMHQGLDIGGALALALASGVTCANIEEFLPYVDAFLVGTGIESELGVLDPDKVSALREKIEGAP